MIRLVALVLTIATGFSGLVYEVTWQRFLATLLGSHSEATASVLGLFLGGLAVGYSLFGWVTEREIRLAESGARPPRLLVVYGVVEMSIGVYALAFATLFSGVQALSTSLPQGSPGVAFAIDVTLSALLVVPPAILMGGTIPILTQALSKDVEDATRLHAFVYGFNTVGAFFGALAAGFWLIPTLGLVGVMNSVAVINLVAGGLFILIGWRRPAALRAAVETAEVAGTTSTLTQAARHWLPAIAALSGFAMMAIQAIINRIGALALGSAEFTFSMVVAVFVLCIATGSFLVSAFERIPRWLLAADLWLLVAVFTGLYLSIDTAPYWVHALRSLYRDNGAAMLPFYANAFAGLTLVIGPAVVLSGATLPLVFHFLRQENVRLGAVAGRIYSWNTTGSLVGALIGGYVLLFWLDLHQIFRIAIAALLVAAVGATSLVSGAAFRGVGPGLAAAAVSSLALLALPAWDQNKLSAGVFRDRQPTPMSYAGPDAFFGRPKNFRNIFYTDGPTTTVNVFEAHVPDGRMERGITVNGKSDGSTIGDFSTMALGGLIPAVFAEKIESAFIVGYGTGVTVGELAALDTVKRVVVSEIAQGVIDAAPLFEFANMGAMSNPKTEILRSDAYRALARSGETFDVVVSEPPTPWVAGVEMLYTEEFLRAAKKSLNPGGVYLQWINTEESHLDVSSMALRTLRSVFSHVAVWTAGRGDLFLMGIEDADLALDIDRIEARATRPDIAAGLGRAGVPGFEALLAHELVPLDAFDPSLYPGPLHSVLHQRLGHLAARAFFIGRPADLPFVATPAGESIGLRNSLAQRLAKREGGVLRPRSRRKIATQTCVIGLLEKCATLLAWWSHEEPASHKQSALLEQMIGGYPEADLESMTHSVAPLFGDSPLHHTADPLQDAKDVSLLYERHYDFAAPFDRSVLAKAWRRCEETPRLIGACRHFRAQAERRVGRIDMSTAALDSAAR